MRKPGTVRECEHPGKPHSHGLDCYRYDKCRCDVGRAANATLYRQRRRRKAEMAWRGEELTVDATGTARRLQALAVNGWSVRALAEAMGVSRTRAHCWRLGTESAESQGRVYQATAQRVRELYDKVWDKPAPGTPGRLARVRNDAARKGWVGPMAWDDDDIDDPLAEPHQSAEEVVDWQAIERAVKLGRNRGRPILTKAERKAGATMLAHRGATASEISKTFGLSGSDARQLVEEMAA